MSLDLKKTGQFIQSCRKDLNMTQAELAERLNVSPQSVSNWERGESIADVATLPDLAKILRCSVDAILSGGGSSSVYRRHITVAQMREALNSVNRIGELLGRDHFIYTTIIDGLNTRMNTTIERAFNDDHIFEVFVLEFLLACVKNGDYVDPRDVQINLKPSKARDYVLTVMYELGIR